ncbi:uncharacterized protein LOC132314294 [Cornus florida]|uniref:uncharacterized protein LOC132314294 n=1 Tax=Cornus florida TaxID=4283 RepID=UPI00289F02B2|nr:uncharacterized protein LOC132314294 [Cornus florida]
MSGTMQLGLSDVEILQLDPRVTVDSLISNNQWEVPISLQQIPFFQSQAFTLQLQNIPPPSYASDKVEWFPSSPNEYSHRLTMDYFTPPSLVFAWDQLVWFKHHIPKHGYIVWLALKKRLATLDTKPMMKKHYTNACYLCLAHEESLDHIFFKCQFSSRIWEIVQHAAGFYIKPDSWNDLITWCATTWMQDHFITHKLLLSSAIYFIWQERNARAFRNKSSPPTHAIHLIKGCIRARFSSLKLKHNSDIRRITSLEGMHQLFLQGCSYAHGQSWFLLQ